MPNDKIPPVTSAEAAASKKGASIPKAKPKVATKPHPTTAEMVKTALVELNSRKGSSLQAIKKYIASVYLLDIEKQAPLIRKHLKSAVEKGFLIRTKGIGASGSFKIAAAKDRKLTDSPKLKVKKAAKAKKSTETSKAKSKDGKSEGVKSKDGKSEGVKSKDVKSKSSSKAKKNVKSPVSKPKAPKPKTTSKVAAKK